jgi:hypothetical protein
MRSISVKIGGKFTRLRGHIICPRSLTTWAKYAIYGGIDKIPQICHGYGYMWSKVGLCGGKWGVQLHIYQTIYNLVVFSSKLVVYILVDHL